MSRPRNRNEKIVPGAEPAIDALKYEIAADLGLQDVIDQHGWTRLTTLDAGNVGGAIQQIINELGQRSLINYYREGRIKEISHLSPGTQPEKYDLTRTRLMNTLTDVTPEFAKAHSLSPGQAQVEPGQTPNTVQQATNTPSYDTKPSVPEFVPQHNAKASENKVH
jgi:hypothetical protein